MKKGLSEIVCVVDRSGSMGSMIVEARNALNHFIEEQKKLPGECRFSLTMFDTDYEFPHKSTPLQQVEPVTEKTYFPRGATALYDAVGKTIDELGARLRDTAEDERPERIVFVILSDGFENSSKEYKGPQVKGMIAEQRDKWKWQFVFLAAGEDAFKASDLMGIAHQHVYHYAAANPHQHSFMLRSAAQAVSDYRTTGATINTSAANAQVKELPDEDA